LEKAQPKANAGLGQRILDAGGVWVSEHGHGVPASPDHFPLRNRIQVGLSVGSIVVEGAINSGTSVHAAYCLREKRVLFAVLPDGVSTHHDLPRSLILRGAQPIRSREDYPGMLSRLEAALPTPHVDRP
ncbi:MAG TPA: DNA-processing protein DprA, partial [Albitalea sp.]|nr:DNA-processing protein DprA [Albitalea sp.]